MATLGILTLFEHSLQDTQASDVDSLPTLLNRPLILS